jgi:hypothetical protein
MTQAGYFMLGVVVGIILNIYYVRRLRIRAEEWPKRKVDTTKPKKLQRVVRVWSHDDLDYTYVGFTHWHSEQVNSPEIIGKIHDHLRNALEIRLYISKAYIEYTAITRTRGQVSGGCHRMGPYDFFEFGIRKSGHRFDIYGEDRKDPTIKAFFDWWGNLVKEYEAEFDKDFNL